MPIDSPQRFQREFFSQNPTIEPMIQVMEQAPAVSLFVKDVQSRYVHANAETLVTHNLKREEDIIGKRARDFFPNLLANAYEIEDEQVFESGKPVLNQTWLVPHVLGAPQWFVSSKSPLLDIHGSVIGLVGLMHAIAPPSDQRGRYKELRVVIEFIEKHFVDEITVTRLASLVGVSAPHFNRRFRQVFRLSPMEYVTSLRIQEAQRLLATTSHSVGEVALATGFYDQSHFTKRFRQVVELTPLKYRKKYRSPS
jgi:AraC-like DNA-binding protein